MKRHLVRVVADSMTEHHLFKTQKELNQFVNKFNTKYKGKQMDGYWVDLICYDIHGDIIDDGVLLE